MTAKSDLLRFDEARQIYRLIEACRELGSDPALWQPRMLEGLCGIVGASAAAGGEGRWLRPHQPPAAVSAFAAGLDEGARALYRAYHREVGPQSDPIFQALQHLPGRLVVRSRKEVVPDATWYRSPAWNDYRRPVGLDNQLTSVLQVTDRGAVNVIGLHRAKGERDFSPRERVLLRFFHEEAGRLIGGALVSELEPRPEQLPPRVRQTLSCLLQGDSEKQVAARLRLSRPTVHQYVTTLYRHFGVNSRAQLLVHAAKRSRQWSGLEPGQGETQAS